LTWAERALAVHVDRNNLVHGEASIGGPTDRGTWVKLEARPDDHIGMASCDGVEAAASLEGVARPEWLGSVSWPDKPARLLWRADEMELVEAKPVQRTGPLGSDPRLPARWWRTWSATLNALGRHQTSRCALVDGVPVTSELVKATAESAWPGAACRVDEWTCAHGALTWSKVTGPECWLLGWHGWGLAPRGLDAATLWSSSLAVPAVAEQIWHEQRAELESVTGYATALFCLARLLAHTNAEDERLRARIAEAASCLVSGRMGCAA
jgi:hypothetical protein